MGCLFSKPAEAEKTVEENEIAYVILRSDLIKQWAHVFEIEKFHEKMQAYRLVDSESKAIGILLYEKMRCLLERNILR
jgi:hypothetical protein